MNKFSLNPKLLVITTIFVWGSHGIPVVHAEVTRTQIESTTASTTQSQPLSQVNNRAREWGLSQSEWQRYQELMGGIRGSLSVPAISPIEVLGIHARNEEERRHYAELWARIRHEDAERVLAFERAYEAAARRMYPGPAIDHARLAAFRAAAGKPLQENKTALQAGDRILLFALPGCTGCDSATAQAMALIRQRRDIGLDIYILNAAGDDNKVRMWAQDHAIDPALLDNRRVTLNHDGGILKRIRGSGVVPYAVLRRGEQLIPYPELTAQ